MSNTTRRDFLKTTTAGAAALGASSWFNPLPGFAAQDSPNERPVLGCIGTGSRWNAVGPNAMKFADCVAVCDVDTRHTDKAKKRVEGIQKKEGVEVYENYEDLLARDDIDVVTIVTPDHWHTKMAIDAMKAGKDVYCEKPLTLTVEEGRQIIKVLEETGRTFQVGTQQRSEMGQKFLKAVALVADGRIGKLTSVECRIGAAPSSGPIPRVAVPKELNWDRWLGQAPMVDFRQNGKKTRAHYEFRWWYEYSGGKMTDWGAHHVDIANWALVENGQGDQPTSFDPVMAKHPVELDGNGMPKDETQYNTATGFKVECPFPKGAQLTIRHDDDNGILFTGTEGRFFVSRGKLAGAPVEELKTKPLDKDLLVKLSNGFDSSVGNAHMANFFHCIEKGTKPVSDVWTHHRAMTICHLANISIRLGRKLEWNAKTQEIVGDSQANAMQSRPQRKGYEITV